VLLEYESSHSAGRASAPVPAWLGEKSVELEPVEIAEAGSAARRGFEDYVQIMNASCRAGWSSGGVPGLPSRGNRNRDRCGEDSGNAVQMEFESSAAIAGAGQTGADAGHAGAEVHILVDGVVAIAGEGDVIAAIDVGCILGFRRLCCRRECSCQRSY
jgi:hypothetical protein